MGTTTSSTFLPNDFHLINALTNDFHLINALTCCGNLTCRNEEVEPLTLQQIMCTACRSKCYCSIDCQNTHRKDHMHQCNKDAAKLKEELIIFKYHGDNDDDDADDDDELFQPIPPRDECPSCMLPLPIDDSKKIYHSCCGKVICKGCCLSKDIPLKKKFHCRICGEPWASSANETVSRIEKRMELNDSVAIFNTSERYKVGCSHLGLQKDSQKAFDLCLRAVELGNRDAYNSAAIFYNNGVVVPKDMAKAREYYEKAAKKGQIIARLLSGKE